MRKPQTISFDPDYLTWVLDRLKTRTTRYGEPVELGPATFRFESTPPTYVAGEVVAIRTVPVAQLTDADAAAENFASADELRSALAHHYPDLPADAVVTVAEWRLTGL